MSTSDTCQRCGAEGEDRRTLWMACLYEMNELGLPFEQVKLFTVPDADVKTTYRDFPWTSRSYSSDGSVSESSGVSVLPEFTAFAKVHPRHFYTLLVCKSCRGAWLEAIREWFYK